jgi:hypothetical protein
MLALGAAHGQTVSPRDDSSMFSLFKAKFPSLVNPAVGATLAREPAFPVEPFHPPMAAYGALHRVSLTAAPAQGRIAAAPSDEPPAEAWLSSAAGAAALVNVYVPKRRVQLWRVDPADRTRLVDQRPLAFDARQDRWLLYSAGEAMALPAGRVLFDLNYDDPAPHDRLCVIDLASGAVKSFNDIEPDWPAGLPFHFIDSLQLTPDAVLVAYRTDKVRLGSQRYINRFDHLLLFSPRHPDGLEVARIGIDDGNVRDWRFSDGKLWLQSSDDRGDTPRSFNWSLDLRRVL